eukprot:CAMPEP_0194575462 /NCGR_PEP_ID=MMETSP0292-20121207/10940_1 /TAXON_ID=39354 /ORGANISM="Heterosigma akashiwo, Strain CCMP2393" /LENGTH=402 /DNA_ID=CAMNT_0039427261 /DNA_START=131 /DNA_END=1339 /DNA_ORIENTATION=+
MRNDVKDLVTEYNETEEKLKALQSVGQIIGDVLKQIDDERFIVKASSGPRYVVGCRSKLDKAKLKPGTRVSLDMTTLTIMRQLPREVDPTVYHMLGEDAGGITFSSIGGLNEQIRELREVIELPLTNPELFHRAGNNAPFRHLLLHGPPGTGKTLFAKGLARHSGLEYAILTGGDVAPLGRDAVTELHKLFDWAEASKKGLLLFVDEADAFLRKRSTEHISEDLRNALNAFLYRTGEATGKFMLVYASNQPDQFDWAVNDRIDEMVEFRLPGLDERRKMINMYLKKYLIDQEGAGRRAKTIMVHGIEDKDIEDVARRTENFSGREISKLAIAWQAAAYGSDGAEFTPDMMRAVLEVHCQQKDQKRHWLDKAELRALTMDHGSTSATSAGGGVGGEEQGKQKH